MLTNIYVNNNNNVETYITDINLEHLKQLQKRIDISFGKGEPKTYRGRYLKWAENKKIEILSKKQVGWGLSACDYFYNQSKEPVYLYRYYEYDQHLLSKICEYFINCNKENSQIKISQGLKELLKYKPIDKRERKYFYEILSSFQFAKCNTDEIIESKINLEDKKNIIVKLKQLLTKSTQLEQKILIPKSYLDLINFELRVLERLDKEVNGCRNLKFYDYTEEARNEYPKKTLHSLPNKEQLEKHNLLK